MLENILWNFHPFKFNGLFWVYYVHLKELCIWYLVRLSWNIVYMFVTSTWLIALCLAFAPLLIFCLFVLSIIDKGELKFPTIIVELNIFPLFLSVLLHVFWYTVMRFVCIYNYYKFLCIDTLIIMKCASLSPVTFLLLKTILTDTSIAILPFLESHFMFAWYTFFILFSIFVSFNLLFPVDNRLSVFYWGGCLTWQSPLFFFFFF